MFANMKLWETHKSCRLTADGSAMASGAQVIRTHAGTCLVSAPVLPVDSARCCAGLTPCVHTDHDGVLLRQGPGERAAHARRAQHRGVHHAGLGEQAKGHHKVSG